MDLTIIQGIILGIIQGITEWLPVSSSGMLSLTMTNFFDISSPMVLIKIGLFLHLGTLLASIVYFRRDLIVLIKALFNYKKSSIRTKKVFNFLFVATVISGLIGIVFLKVLEEVSDNFEMSGRLITFGIAALLLLTGVMQLKIKKSGVRSEKDLNLVDGILLGIAQGFATLPGLSRSGTTVAVLLLRKVDDTAALKLSFLMSIPIVLAGNVLLNLSSFSFSLSFLFALFASFLLGILTIHGLIKFSRRINFGWFLVVFSVVMGLSVLI